MSEFLVEVMASNKRSGTACKVRARSEGAAITKAQKIHDHPDWDGGTWTVTRLPEEGGE